MDYLFDKLEVKPGFEKLPEHYRKDPPKPNILAFYSCIKHYPGFEEDFLQTVEEYVSQEADWACSVRPVLCRGDFTLEHLKKLDSLIDQGFARVAEWYEGTSISDRFNAAKDHRDSVILDLLHVGDAKSAVRYRIKTQSKQE